ncbi:hypothetical protein JX266_014044 [Neoarthrinium moseri]|nr:hypothetical protein JX266_014044 [Neoarthrinium moseri]
MGDSGRGTQCRPAKVVSISSTNLSQGCDPETEKEFLRNLIQVSTFLETSETPRAADEGQLQDLIAFWQKGLTKRIHIEEPDLEERQTHVAAMLRAILGLAGGPQYDPQEESGLSHGFSPDENAKLLGEVVTYSRVSPVVLPRPLNYRQSLNFVSTFEAFQDIPLSVTALRERESRLRGVLPMIDPLRLRSPLDLNERVSTELYCDLPYEQCVAFLRLKLYANKDIGFSRCTDEFPWETWLFVSYRVCCPLSLNLRNYVVSEDGRQLWQRAVDEVNAGVSMHRIVLCSLSLLGLSDIIAWNPEPEEHRANLELPPRPATELEWVCRTRETFAQSISAMCEVLQHSPGHAALLGLVKAHPVFQRMGHVGWEEKQRAFWEAALGRTRSEAVDVGGAEECAGEPGCKCTKETMLHRICRAEVKHLGLEKVLLPAGADPGIVRITSRAFCWTREWRKDKVKPGLEEILPISEEESAVSSWWNTGAPKILRVIGRFQDRMEYAEEISHLEEEFSTC